MKRVICIFYIFIMTFMNQVWSEDINIHISGNVIFPPCKINNKDIGINFDEIKDDYNNKNPMIKGTIIILNCDYHIGAPYVTIEGERLPGGPSNTLGLKRTGGGESAIGVEFYQGLKSEGVKILIGDDPYKNKVTSGLSGGDKNLQFLMSTVLFRLADKKLLSGNYRGTAILTFSYF